MRSPSIVAQSGTRGREPVGEQDRVGLELLDAFVGVGRDRVRAGEAAGAAQQPHALRLEQAGDAVAQRRPPCPRCGRAARRRRGGRPRRAPSCLARASSVSSLPVATIALLGMQSQRCAAPPTMSRSIIVTSAPSDAATVAAVLPAGPPPMITNRTGMWSRLRAAAAPTLTTRAGAPHRRAHRRRGDPRARSRDCGPTRSACTSPTPSGAGRPTVRSAPGNEHDDAARGRAHRAAAPPTRRAGRCASCRTCTRSSATVRRPARTKSIVLLPRARRGSSTRSRSMPRPTCSSRCATAPRIHLDAGLAYAQPFVNHGQGRGRVDRASARPAGRARRSSRRCVDDLARPLRTRRPRSRGRRHRRRGRPGLPRATRPAR